MCASSDMYVFVPYVWKRAYWFFVCLFVCLFSTENQDINRENINFNEQYNNSMFFEWIPFLLV